jgi:transposase
LSAQRIYQDLVEEKGFSDSYQSVQRFVRKLKVAQPQRVWRMEARPGEEVQVDFGLGAPIWEGSGRPRRSWFFRMVLSYSRKAYSEAVLRQDTETFLRCLENGLRAFGGVPLLLNLDNLKAAVLKADWFDPELTRSWLTSAGITGSTLCRAGPLSHSIKAKWSAGLLTCGPTH